jgi:hypothetical protein
MHIYINKYRKHFLLLAFYYIISMYNNTAAVQQLILVLHFVVMYIPIAPNVFV